MKKQFLLLLTLSLFSLSCKQHLEGGTYLTYDIKTTEKSFLSREMLENDTISGFLKSKLRDKKYQISYHEDYAVLKDLEENEETILAKAESKSFYYGKDYGEYRTTIPKGSQTFELRLYPHNTNNDKAILLVDLIVPIKKIFMPAQVGGDRDNQYGRAFCFLSRIEDK